MSRYNATYGYPKADLSIFSDTVHILPPKTDGRTDDDGIPEFTHDYALKEQTIREYSDRIQDDELRADVEQADKCSDELKEAVGIHFAHELEKVPCNRCGAMVWVDNWAGKYARNKCADCASKCPECGAKLKETKVCLESPRSTRRGNKYQCDPEQGGCGRTWRGISTG